MKNLKLLFFVFILFICPNVFADTSYNMTSLITSPVNYNECGSGSYTGVELNGATNCWNTNTRYQGTLNRIYFNLPAPTGTVFESDTSYRLTLNMATQDWRNNFGSVVVSPGSSYTNNFVDTFTFVSMKQVNITFTVPYTGSTTYQYLYVNLPAKNSSSLITGTSNWNLSNVTLTKLTSGSGGGSSTPSGPTTTFDDTAIINSGKENTQDIINNNNTNTSDIINNNNSNTQSINDTINNAMTTLCPNIIQRLDTSYDNNCTYNSDFLSVSCTGFDSDTYFSIISLSSPTDDIYTLSFNAVGVGNNNIYYYIDSNVSNRKQLKEGVNTITIPINQTLDHGVIMFDDYGSISNSVTISFSNFILTRGTNYVPWCLYGTQVSKIDETNSTINNSTNTIINNNNQNTEQIIDNQNQNTEQIIESNKVCEKFDGSVVLDKRSYLDQNGNIISNPYFQGVSRYISITPSTTIKVLSNSELNGNYLCFYNSSKVKINCLNQYTFQIGTLLNIPSNAKYFRYSLLNNRPSLYICSNGNDSINNSITDSNVDSDTGTGFFDDFTSQDFGLSQIITIPLNTIQSLTSKTCSPLSVPIPFTNSSVDLPCMTQIYESKFSTIYNLWKIVSFGIVAYLIAIDIFHIVKGFKDPESDKVEVLDL